MIRYVVGYIDFFNNELILEEVLANNAHEALWQHSKLQESHWQGSVTATEGMDSEELQDWSFDSDMCVSILEIS
jgi:hypothetical protein